MDALTLKRIDRALWPAAALARAVSLALRRRPLDSRSMILRPGGMGDLILLCVAIENLGRDPREFFWVIEKRSRIWARHLGLDHLCYNDRLFHQHWRIAGRFSTVVNSEQFFGLSQATAALACANRRALICFDTNRAAAFATVRVNYDPDKTHEAVSFQELLAAALKMPAPCSPEPPLRQRASPAAEPPVIGLSGLQSESRALSEEQWERFIQANVGSNRFWIASSDTDREMARRLAQRFPGRATVFERDFDALCDLIRRSEAVLTVDGGFLHIASYYGVRTIGVFTSGRDRKWAPLAPGSTMLMRRDLACRPCVWFGQIPPCPHKFACKEIPF
jgi:ADP-heptose:LPS heptosyltransferase